MQSPNPMGLCETCQRLEFDKLPFQNDKPWLFHKNYSAICKCATSCRLCMIIKQIAIKNQLITIEKHKFNKSREWMSSSKVPDLPFYLTSEQPHNDIQIKIAGNWYKRTEADTEHSVLVGLFVRRFWIQQLEDENGKVVSKKTMRVIDYEGSSHIRICTELDGPLAYTIPERVQEQDSSSEVAMKTACLWSWQCNVYHNCIKEKSTLPTRVIELLPPQTESCISVRLRETFGEQGNYIALSHCWGTSPRLTTTMANLDTHKQSMCFASLPKTFRDTIILAQKLEINYIWIDSLCIVQDDLNDWEREATLMCDVYAGSFLTISALAASDDSEGVFWGRETARKIHTNNFPFGEPSGGRWEGGNAMWSCVNTSGGKGAKVWFCDGYSNNGTNLVYSVKTLDAHGDKPDNEPLNLRGWAFQERLLSPRLLHFGTTQMYWECQKLFRREDGASSDAPKNKMSELIRSHTQGDALGWQQLIEEYSKRKLTFGRDKLPAIAGLAKYIAAATGDSYFAGLWKSHFVAGLNWSTDYPKPTLKAEHYRAPSWSFASLDTKIKYHTFRDGSICVGELIDCHIKALGGNPFGQIVSANATIRAPLFEARLVHVPRSCFDRLVGVKHGKHQVMGLAERDVGEPKYNCHALFLDYDYALLLRPATAEEAGCGEREEGGLYQHIVFVRVGWANFNVDRSTARNREIIANHLCHDPATFQTVVIV